MQSIFVAITGQRSIFTATVPKPDTHETRIKRARLLPVPWQLLAPHC